MVVVLGVNVPADLFDSWATWVAPDPQPFLVGADDGWTKFEGQRGSITPELRDTYRLWGVAKDSRVVWLSEEEFLSLPRMDRAALTREQVVRRRGGVPTVRGWSDLLDAGQLREQSDGHRFVWWRSLIAQDPVRILSRLISTDRLSSQHSQVGESTWRGCAETLPGARALAGTFPTGSNACCFSTVMTAAGADATGACDSLDPFRDWLSTACRPGGDDRRPGTVLVWRDRSGDLVHAAVSIGEGWALEKPSQEWHSPQAVAAIRSVVRTSRMAGQRLERHTIIGSSSVRLTNAAPMCR